MEFLDVVIGDGGGGDCGCVVDGGVGELEDEEEMVVGGGSGGIGVLMVNFEEEEEGGVMSLWRN